MEEDWDYLIILDACRFDFFERAWERLQAGGAGRGGRLSRKTSAGSATVEWRDNSFTDRYEDVVYVSSNPYINSLMPVKGFLGNDHFAKVYDVWKTDWDEDIGTVRPEAVTRTALVALRDNPDRRLIVHYLQPHAPYLSLGRQASGFPMPDLSGDRVLTGVDGAKESGIRAKLLRLLTGLCYKSKLLGENPSWRLRQLLRMDPASPMDAARRKHGREGLMKAYEENLHVVLDQVVKLIDYMAGTIVVTSDHGELLGEKGRYSHFGGSTDPYLIDIPWLVIEKATGEEPGIPDDLEAPDHGKESGEDEARIKARLRALGYID
jgi:hypothetical protein